jgi:hypothetical protein
MIEITPVQVDAVKIIVGFIKAGVKPKGNKTPK